ncbi:MAG: YggU family protein [Nitrosomonadales bacterium]|nr:YggU family protein [Nitrosomonadales bacterium]
MATWYRREGGSITLMLHIQPGARRSELAGLHGEALKIRLAAPPIEGRANEALLRFIAELFKVALRDVELLRGAQSRHKMVKVTGSGIEPESLPGMEK